MQLEQDTSFVRRVVQWRHAVFTGIILLAVITRYAEDKSVKNVNGGLGIVYETMIDVSIATTMTATCLLGYIYFQKSVLNATIYRTFGFTFEMTVEPLLTFPELLVLVLEISAAMGANLVVFLYRWWRM